MMANKPVTQGVDEVIERARREMDVAFDALEGLACLFGVIEYAVTRGEEDHLNVLSIARIGRFFADHHAERASNQVDYFKAVEVEHG